MIDLDLMGKGMLMHDFASAWQRRVATSFTIEITQELTSFGMFDINDILANSIESCIGIGMVWLWQYVRRNECREVT